MISLGTQKSPEVWVDYNDVDERENVLTLVKFFAPGIKASVGLRVRTGDFEGNRCEGTIVELQDRGVVAISLDFDTLTRVQHLAPSGS